MGLRIKETCKQLANSSICSLIRQGGNCFGRRKEGRGGLFYVDYVQ